MAKRDPNKTARNKKIAAIKAQRRALQLSVFQELATVEHGKYCNESSLNAFIGSKTDEYIDLREEVIRTPAEYTNKWLLGLKAAVTQATGSGTDPRHHRMYDLLRGSNPNFQKYVSLFLESSFLRHYEEHYKKKPKLDESAYWFGENQDDFGLLVTPRFANGGWENDKSEIRHFKHPYWTVAHVLTTGLCYMNENRMRTFTTRSDYLQFFRDLVRRTKSQYQLDIADRYNAYVEQHATPDAVPLLIPELRYDPLKQKHQHRLDFVVINPWSMEKVGFEFSPWSTHGQLAGKHRNLGELNSEARANFEREMRKLKKYWRKFEITYVVYTDEDLADMDSVWAEMKTFLEPEHEPEQLDLGLFSELLGQ